jgi:hypothetical protein
MHGVIDVFPIRRDHLVGERYEADCTLGSRCGGVAPHCAQECAALSCLSTTTAKGTFGLVQLQDLG